MTGSPNAGQRRTFPKRWGAEFVRADEVLFRVWAPGADRLVLRLDGSDTPMTRNDEGWFELLATGVAPDTPYAFVLPNGEAVPDPATRGQSGDVHGPSLIVDPTSYAWSDGAWSGRPWEESVILELHVGTFTPEGTFRAAAEKLGDLAQVGITAIEIMPVAQFSGNRGWGYDGVLLYAPHRAYGTPDDMKAFIDAAHASGIQVFLDVVYNHFGPDGNYLPLLAPQFFHPERSTPWGAAIAYELEPVRSFFIENALYWLEEFHLDGLRLDAIDQIRDPQSEVHILEELARRVRGEFPDRQIHLTTEDNRNITHLHERDADRRVRLYTAEWNDDFHNAAHVAVTGEVDGYYEDFAQEPWKKLARALAEGFAYQGEPSPHLGEQPRGMASAHLPPTAFVDFLQNHDQIGNRAFGERLSTLVDRQALRCLTAVLLLSPHIPLMFMGEEWAETRPFCFFTDFHGELADAVREGRRREFAKFEAFKSEAKRAGIPDPNDEATFRRSRIDWSGALNPDGTDHLSLIRRLLELRRQHIVPMLRDSGLFGGTVLAADDGMLAVNWEFGNDLLEMRANLSGRERSCAPLRQRIIFGEPQDAADMAAEGFLPPRAVVFASSASRSET